MNLNINQEGKDLVRIGRYRSSSSRLKLGEAAMKVQVLIMVYYIWLPSW